MPWITKKRACGNCGCTQLTRYHRSFWMKAFRGSQFLRCRQCRSTILLLRNHRDPEAEVEPEQSFN